MKDIIISGGLNISAAEVERVVAGFDGVFEVAVIGAADAKFGETPLAIIHSTLPLQIEQIVAHCNQNLADYKVPRYIVVEAEPLPRMPTGKIAKPALRAPFAGLVPTLTRVRYRLPPRRSQMYFTPGTKSPLLRTPFNPCPEPTTHD